MKHSFFFPRKNSITTKRIFEHIIQNNKTQNKHVRETTWFLNIFQTLNPWSKLCVIKMLYLFIVGFWVRWRDVLALGYSMCACDAFVVVFCFKHAILSTASSDPTERDDETTPKHLPCGVHHWSMVSAQLSNRSLRMVVRAASKKAAPKASDRCCRFRDAAHTDTILCVCGQNSMSTVLGRWRRPAVPCETKALWQNTTTRHHQVYVHEEWPQEGA